VRVRQPSRFILASVMLALLVPGHAVAQQPAPANPQTGDVVVNMRDVEIAIVAEQISRITGRTLILDPSVKGTVNVTSAEPLTPSGVWELFQSVLRTQGFATVRSGRAWRIVPQANAVREPSGGTVNGQQVVTRMIRLRNLSPETAARVFRPLVASFGSVESVTSPNAIVVTDYADNIRRIERLAASLDGGGGDGFDSIALRYASARDVANAIRGILGDGGEGATGPRAVADERSNVVLVRGDARSLAEARRMARLLDQPGGATPTTRVFRLKNNDAEAVTAIIRGLMGGEAQANNPIARTLSDTGGDSLGAGSLNSFDRGLATPPSGVANLSANPAFGAGASNAPSPATRSSSDSGSSQGFMTDSLAVQPAPELNAIVVRGTPAAIAAIEPLILELDIRRPQVLIEAAIVEITGDRAEQLGIQLGIGGAAAAVDNSAGTSFSNVGLPLRQILSVLGAPAAIALGDGFTGNFGSRGDFGILVQALGTSTRANLLSTPSLTTLDNQPAEIVVGQNVPFRTGSYATDGNTTTPFTTIQREDVGITLRVVPRVHDGDVIRLEVSQEVSSLVGSITGAADLITNRRAIQTTVLADDGQTIVLGGLISDDRMQVKSQVPVLGSIPILGELFKSRRESTTRRTLFVFLRPTILRDKAAVAAAAALKYDRVRGAEAAVLDDDRSLLLEPPRARLTQEIDGIY
jgi:general secretion pathway protein D